MGIKHKYQSNRDDGADNGDVQPSAWNDDHEVTGILASFLNVASQPSSFPYVKADGSGATSPLSEFGRALFANMTEAAFRAAIGALAKSGDTMTGDLVMGGHKVTGIGAPTSPADAATKEYADNIAAAASGALVFKGSWDASAGTFPGAGAAAKGFFYKVSVAGTVDAKAFEVGDSLYAVADNASAAIYANNWLKIEGGISLAEVQAAVGFTFGGLAAASAVTASQISDASANGRSLIMAADYAAMKVLLGITSTVTASQISDASANGRSLITAADYAAMKTLLGLTSSGLVSVDVYNSSQTITIPAGATRAVALIVGGTGGGVQGGSAGAGAGAALKYLSGLTPANTLTWTRGAAGASTPTAGGNSSLASGTQTISTITANGGAPGAADADGIVSPLSTGGTASGGDINVIGQGGPSFASQASGDSLAAHGGMSGFGLSKGGDANMSGGNTVGVAGFALMWWFS